jgi:hypothetical protein
LYLTNGDWVQAKACLDEAWSLVSEHDEVHYRPLRRELTEHRQELGRLGGSSMT